jgi:hypothetical protein
VGKCGTSRQATDDFIIQHMCFTCWITKSTDMHLEYVILLFHSNNGMQSHLNIMFVPAWPVLLTFTEVIRWNMKAISVLCTSVCLKISLLSTTNDNTGSICGHVEKY